MLEHALSNALSNAILFTVGLRAVYSRALKVRDYCLFCGLFFAVLFTIVFSDFRPLMITYYIIPALAISWLTGRKRSMIVFYILYIIIGLTVLPVSSLINVIAGHQMSYTDQNPMEMAITVFFSAVICFPVICVLKKLYLKYLAKIVDRLDGKLFLYITVLMGFNAFFIYGIMTITAGLPNEDYYLLIGLVALYIFLNCASIVVILITTRKNYEQQQRIRDLNTLREYTDNLEATYNNLRSFKHDYVNILSTLSIYIDEKKYDELDVFFYENIMPLTKELTKKNASLANLSRIKNLEIKGIFYTKLLSAINKNIDVTVDIPDEITKPGIDSIDLTRVLGIYLDNAIEAALETDNPVLTVHSGTSDKETVFIISNSYVDHGLSVSQMYKKGVSTKGEDHGLGLYNVSEILSKYANVFTETSMEDGLFVQKLQVI